MEKPSQLRLLAEMEQLIVSRDGSLGLQTRDADVPSVDTVALVAPRGDRQRREDEGLAKE